MEEKQVNGNITIFGENYKANIEYENMNILELYKKIILDLLFNMDIKIYGEVYGEDNMHERQLSDIDEISKAVALLDMP